MSTQDQPSSTINRRRVSMTTISERTEESEASKAAKSSPQRHPEAPSFVPGRHAHHTAAISADPPPPTQPARSQLDPRALVFLPGWSAPVFFFLGWSAPVFLPGWSVPVCFPVWSPAYIVDRY
ncbi:hypothetical protein BU16DRAFT_554149 [Lophium mytilinum]|uniref:Uncharacterized protein n=1 Tax=Lophium mytilinum TaxID=390894 RepID=A0A6A6REC5_9PEZI|nr:hypothetical protein BU16DRAFT_554149 [Lophium mytilinum]